MARLYDKFAAQKQCASHEDLLHYTSDDVLRIMLNKHTLRCNSILNVNDLLEKKRLGLENVVGAYYVACFCHAKHEIVPFWYMYGSSVPKERRVLLKFKNFSQRLEFVFDGEAATTAENKTIYFDSKWIFQGTIGNCHFAPRKDPQIEMRQTIEKVRMIEIDYLEPSDKVFSDNYRVLRDVTFGNATLHDVPVVDATMIGHRKTVNWQYEEETRIICVVKPLIKYVDYIDLRMKPEIFKDLRIVVNPWATESFINDIKQVISDCELSAEIKSTISVCKSELDGQIIGD